MDRTLLDEYDKWAFKSNRSRNELMCMALRYALKKIKFVEKEKSE